MTPLIISALIFGGLPFLGWRFWDLWSEELHLAWFSIWLLNYAFGIVWTFYYLTS